MFQHEKYMQRCIELARLGAGSVSPNPMVGSVIVCEDRIIGEGYHAHYGEAHAEVNAIRNVTETHADAADLLKKSTLYVNLEPCSHFGKTPPCTDLIISKQIPRVVIGCRDPFSQVDGKGIQKLRTAGIKVIENILVDSALELNKRFYTRVRKQRPYIILKWAQTANGFFAPADGTKKWITSLSSKQLVHRWRTEEDAVLVGKNTALADNPRLNVREWTGRDPIRIVIDKTLELPKDLHVFDQTQHTIVFNTTKTGIEGNIKYLELENFDNLLPQLIAYQLYLMDIQSLIVEGGAKTLNMFIKAGLWDEARVFSSPDYWREGIPALRINWEADERLNIGPDILRIWHNEL